MKGQYVSRLRGPRVSSGPAREDVCPVTLRSAVQRAWEPWLECCGEALSEHEASEFSEAMVSAIRDSGRDGAVDFRLKSSPGRRLLEMTQAELVQIWQTDPGATSTTGILATLQSIEAVRATIAPDAAEAFADQIAGQDNVEFLVGMAHDLRSPLTSILFLAETLQRRLSGEINDLQHRQLGLIYSAALGLSEMAGNILELIRGGNRLASDEPSPFSVRDIFESVLDITRPMADEKGLTIRLNPPATDHRLGYPLALSRVLLNLTTNALKFTEEGFVEIVAIESGVNKVEFSVRDSGRGIDPAALETLFSPFRQQKRGKGAAFSGTGLGLALCRRLVAAMGSELQLETKAKWGTRFFFQLELLPVLKD